MKHKSSKFSPAHPPTNQPLPSKPPSVDVTQRKALVSVLGGKAGEWQILIDVSRHCCTVGAGIRRTVNTCTMLAEGLIYVTGADLSGAQWAFAFRFPGGASFFTCRIYLKFDHSSSGGIC